MNPSVVRFGPYQIRERLGEGGMCWVFRATREDDPKEYALKLLKDAHLRDERMRQMFTTEIDVALLLEHPNLVKSHDAGEVDGRMYLAMELIEGGSLADVVAEMRARRFLLPPDLALFVVNEMLEGLQALHDTPSKTGKRLGLVHRDVTPHNIFLSFDGRVILGDFGVTHIQAYGEVEPAETLGKLGYLAPEVVNGEEMDHRADLFGAGLVLYELLTGRPAYDAETDEEGLVQAADARVVRPSRHLPHMDRGLEAVLLRALARRPKDRFQTAEEMLVELEPHWSKHVANPYAMQALLTALRPHEAAAWSARSRAPAAGSVQGAWPT
ncbi:MAG TPA: serine/threonine-protein kinase [Myxococcales bacterium LLY-WYZ-16_1]|nr:serine/threonine-protein kinase [Myxococcales bacterium LLY-WYZ-16_1]